MDSLQAAEQGRDDDVIHGILSSIAEQTQCDVLDLPALNHTIDTEALGALVRSPAVAEITFDYHGYEVVVSGRDQVTVSERQPSR